VRSVTPEEFLTAFAAEIGAPVPSREDMDVLLEVASIAAVQRVAPGVD
jgi:hypothetical protein